MIGLKKNKKKLNYTNRTEVIFINTQISNKIFLIFLFSYRIVYDSVNDEFDDNTVESIDNVKRYKANKNVRDIISIQCDLAKR